MRWRSAATTASGAQTSISFRNWASPISGTVRRSTARGLGTASTTGRSPIRRFTICGSATSSPLPTCVTFGVPDWIGNFQNPDFPQLFAEYASAFATRYPWVQLYTPVNEMYICAAFSAIYGWWNEQLKSDRAFVTALKHLVKANVLAMLAIVEVRPDAIFIQSESSEYFHAENPQAIKPAEILNARRFLSLDLNYGRRVESEMYEYLMDNGMTRDEYHFFLGNNLKHHCIMGNDYYVTNEHRVSADGAPGLRRGFRL